jgi:alkanesulfonate monooxygenase SsuD/methylene tetrahydromethanopterin reductase-like flavin-dependent oxidoreductase (luciferase family)/predicted kinase
MHRLADGTLVVLVGPSASGKSAWAAEHFVPDQVVSSDRLRAVVGEGEQDLGASADAFAVLEQIVRARVGRRLTTVVDTTGMDGDRRRAWRGLAAERRVPCVAVVFDTEPAECRRRNADRPHRVPAAVLSGQLRAYAVTRKTLETEGFDEVIIAGPVRVVPASVAAAARAETGPATSTGTSPASTPVRPSVGMRFGLHLSTFDVPGGAAALREVLPEVCARAEAAGFTSIWVMDHLRQIPQLGRAWDDLPESLVTLGYLAAATRTASIGALVHCVTLRNVALLGKSLATLDVLSGGRVWCGLGAGWFEAEHRAYGIPFPGARERLDLLEDALTVLPALWGPGSPRVEGARTEVPEALCYPRPLHGRIPILVGGGGERRTLRLAARYADACNVTGDSNTLRRKVSVLRAHCADVGRDPAQVEVTHLSTVLVAGDERELDAVLDRRRPTRGVARWTSWVNPGTVEDHVLRARDLQAAGAQHLIVALDDVWASPAVERFGEVIDAVRDG